MTGENVEHIARAILSRVEVSRIKVRAGAEARARAEGCTGARMGRAHGSHRP